MLKVTSQHCICIFMPRIATFDHYYQYFSKKAQFNSIQSKYNLKQEETIGLVIFYSRKSCRFRMIWRFLSQTSTRPRLTGINQPEQYFQQDRKVVLSFFLMKLRRVDVNLAVFRALNLHYLLQTPFPYLSRGWFSFRSGWRKHGLSLYLQHLKQRSERTDPLW